MVALACVMSCVLLGLPCKRRKGDVFHIQSLLMKHEAEDGTWYLVRWGPPYDSWEDDSWEPEESLHLTVSVAGWQELISQLKC
jgi:hypothetical protein